MTEKLYDYDSYATEFDAGVLSCEKCEKSTKISSFFYLQSPGRCDIIDKNKFMRRFHHDYQGRNI